MSVPTTEGIGSLSQTADVEPWEFFERVRDAGDVVWDEAAHAWLVSSYELVREIALADQELWRGPFVPDPARPPCGLPLETWLWFKGNGSPRMFSVHDGADHDHQHRWWVKAFSPHVLEGWRETRIRPIVHAQIDRFAGRGRAELCSEFADRVGPRVMAGVMALPEHDEQLALITELQHRRFRLKDRQTELEHPPGLVEDALAATRELHELLLPSILERRAGDGDDFISIMWREAPQLFGDDYSEADVIASAIGAWEAGSHTTAYSTANALYLLMTQRGLQDRLRAGGERAVQNFVEEALRLYGPSAFRPRFAKRDVELGGVRIAKGEMVIVLTHAGGRDPRHYECPAEVELNRRRPRDHFAFFRGPRTCPGQGLARAELLEFTTAILERVRDLRVDPEAEQPRFRALAVRSWSPLHALFTPS
jgi:cytochrome P450